MNQTKLKKQKLELEYSINKINNILDCEENLERYIELIENNKFESPSDLNIKILEKLNNTNIVDNSKVWDKSNKENENVEVIKLQKYREDKNKNREINNVESSNTNESNNNDRFMKRIKYKFTDILKIAACTVFALMIWEITPANTTYAKKTQDVVAEENKNIKSEFNLKRKVNDFFMSPIKIERGEK